MAARHSAVLALFVTIGVVGCASNMVSPTNGSLGALQPARKSSVGTTVPLSGTGGSFPLPQFAHFRGNATYTSNDATSAATMTVVNSGVNNLANAPAPPNATPVLYIEASINNAAEVTFSSSSLTMTLNSPTFQAGANYEVLAYEGSQQESSATATLKRKKLTFQTPFSNVTIPASSTLAIEVVQLSSATPTPSPSSDWDSFGYDLQRTGYYPSETSVGAGNVGSLQSVWTFNVGSTMVHEPLYAAGVSVNGQPTNMLYAGSSYGSTMYGINANTGALVWQDPVPSAPYSCSPSQTLQFSIAETPAIDRAKNLIYFADGHNQLHALDLGTGKEAAGWPLTIADYTPDHNFMHGGLTYNPANGLLYAVTGSTCDISPWYGRVVAINTNGPSVVGTFYTMSGGPTQGASGGGIWGPGGASVDPSTNNVFIVTGNADTTTGQAQNAGYSEEMIELNSTLGSVLASNYPTNLPSIYGDNDFDFGATPLLFQPPGCPAMAAAINKSGTFELYDRATISSGPVQYIYMSVATDRGEFVGMPAYDPVTNYVYVGLPSQQGIYNAGMAAFSIQSNCTLNPTPAWAANFGPVGSVSSTSRRSPISIVNGVVYISNFTGDTEYAFNAATGAQLWTTPLSSWGTVGTIVANGIVYVGQDGGAITAWALPDRARVLRKDVVKSAHSKIPSHRFSGEPWRLQ